jgi:hypothetical protein
VREEDIASPFEDLQHNDLFFFFGFFSLTVQDILSAVSPPSSSQALSHTNHPGKTFLTSHQQLVKEELLMQAAEKKQQISKG